MEKFRMHWFCAQLILNHYFFSSEGLHCWNQKGCHLVLFPRFNCGTGAAQILSESSVVPGQWHTVTIFRDGMSGWLRLDNNTPVSGRSQVGAPLRGDPAPVVDLE